MIKKEIVKVITKFQAVARRLPDKLCMLGQWYWLFDEMCYTFAKKNVYLKDKPMVYITTTGENTAINNYFQGKSICSKSQREIIILSFEKLSEFIALPKRFEEDVHNRLLVEKIMALLTQRQRQVALGIMQGSTEVQIASSLGISRQRVNEIKKRIREKAIKILDKGLCS